MRWMAQRRKRMGQDGPAAGREGGACGARAGVASGRLAVEPTCRISDWAPFFSDLWKAICGKKKTKSFELRQRLIYKAHVINACH